jgi:hypothetical protein
MDSQYSGRTLAGSDTRTRMRLTLACNGVIRLVLLTLSFFAFAWLLAWTQDRCCVLYHTIPTSLSSFFGFKVSLIQYGSDGGWITNA